jgi:hypothetical protein
MALNPSSPICSPEPISYSVSPLFKLPVELTLLIFGLCLPGIRARLDLTHICREWRSIAINSPFLWTFIQMDIDFAPYSKRSDNLISLLDIQLGRTNGLPLDVEWLSNTSLGFDPRLLDLIRQKGPFSRWRTLKVRFMAVEAFAPDSCDVFSNLESLIILPSIFNRILQTIEWTTTSKLQFLELQDQGTQVKWEADYMGMVGRLTQRITRLKISSGDTLPIARNIRKVLASAQATHYIPYLKEYTLSLCHFGYSSQRNLESLTRLTVTLGLEMHRDAKVYLPALRHLALGALITGSHSKIDAPVLQTLHLLPVIPGNAHVQRMITGLHLGDYILSPTKSITLDVCLSQYTAGIFLEHSPRVEQVSLSFEDAVSADKMLERMEGVIHVDETEEIVLIGRLCENMGELRINLGYEICDLEAWKKRASRFVEGRRTLGSEPRVYASWKGEGTYVRLA